MWLPTLLFLSILTSASLTNEKRIETVVKTRWAATSLISEAAEFFAEEGDISLFWNFLENVFDKQGTFNPTDDEAETDLASISAFNIVSSAKLRMMEWALTSRAFSPKVLMLMKLAPDQDAIGNCDSFVQFSDGRVSCDMDEIMKMTESGWSTRDSSIVITDTDHKFPSFHWSDENIDGFHFAILYGHPFSSLSKQLHEYLKIKSNEIGYIYRPYRKESKENLILAGYGIELQFKSTEYVAQDDSNKHDEDHSKEIGGFNFDKLHELHPDLTEKLDKFQNHIASARGQKAEFEALKAWQIQELGLQASHFTTLQENFLESLMDVSGNFPSKAASLSSIRVPAEFKRSIAYNQRILTSNYNIDEGEGAFFLQGNYIDPDSTDLFSFMDTLKSELDLMELLKSTHNERPVTRTEIDSILSLGSKSNSEPDLALDLRDSSIFWINDLEKDEEYEDWPDDLTQLFFRMGGVMLRPIRRNVFNLLLTLDPEDTTNTGVMMKLAQSFMAHKAPVRIGVVFCPASTPEMSNAIDEEETKSELIRKVLNYASQNDKIKKAFNAIVDAYSGGDFSKLSKMFNNPDEEFNYGAELSCEFIRKSGRPAIGAFLNGVPLKWDSIDDFEETVLSQLLREAQSVQIDAYNGKVRDDTDVFEYLMNRPHVQTRLNDKILDTSNAKYLSFGTEVWEPEKEPKNAVGGFATIMNYMIPSSKRKPQISVSIWVMSDLSTNDGRLFLQNALDFLEESSTHSRISFVPTGPSSPFASKVLNAFTDNDLKSAIKLLKEYDGKVEEHNLEIDKKTAKFLKTISFPLGGKGLVVNGRLIGPLKPEEEFSLGDWTLVEKFSYDSCAKHLDKDDSQPDTIMRICGALGNPTIKNRNAKRFALPEFDGAVNVEGMKNLGSNPFYIDLIAVVDPASRTANKMATILSAVHDIVGQWVKISVVFNPPPKHSELPLKSYYRYIAGESLSKTVVFENIPLDPLFTQNLIAPDNWMVEVVKGESDLDNIRLRDLKSDVIESEYELEHLLVEGHCLELKTGSPPRGLQFNLIPQSKGSKHAETIVMANLGYFQLKAEPGVWKLNLRDGPSKEIFSLDNENFKPVVVHSFQSVVVKVKVKRNPGKELVSLLETEEDAAGWFNFGGGKKDSDDDTLNIFSLASGHLYERLIKIMMLSVLKNTKSKVKFWFLKNYLSPPLKDVLPHLAEEYGFEYELVQYHWPRWLNPQREKQRIIWGYKILFLDVLFPLSLKKFVFVDADQVVRTDMKELFELDLEGNPYGYTPFCDSRTEMEGFRFWKTGYWRSHLGKRKYHISALYVVDLVRFRKIAAGDRLRGQYQALSQDPNSLSNLDQDLPNNMIHQVGIKSLPQEWLWCETWCHEEGKKTAKTIDLCNNPQTKEPKLEAAQRIVPEWTGYDQEIREFQRKLRLKKNEKLKHEEL